MVWLLALVAVVTLVFVIDAAERRAARRVFLADRVLLPDPEFCEQVCPEGAADRSLWVVVRRALAGHCGVPPEALYPGDRLATLWEMSVTFDGFDPLDVVFRLESLLNTRLAREHLFPASVTPRVRLETLQDLVRFLVERLRAVPGVEARAEPLSWPTDMNNNEDPGTA